MKIKVITSKGPTTEPGVRLVPKCKYSMVGVSWDANSEQRKIVVRDH